MRIFNLSVLSKKSVRNKLKDILIWERSGEAHISGSELDKLVEKFL